MAVSFTKACIDFFGKRPNTTALDFQKELKALDDNDRAYFVREFAKVGIEVDLNANAVKA